MITSKDNKRIKAVVSVGSSARKRREKGLFILEGTRLCSEALREDIRVIELFYTEEAYKNHTELIGSLRSKAEFADSISPEVFGKISDTSSPQGVLLTVAFKTQPVLPKKGKFLAFERVSDTSNLGAAARTAEALGLDGIILSDSGVDPYSPKSLRASMGALLRLPILITNDFLGTLKGMAEEGFVLSGTVVDADALKLGEITFSQNEVALIGNEANGLTEAAKSICNRLITIPMAGRAESLNAAAAAGIVMWEMVH